MQFNKNVPSVGLPRLPCLARIIGHAVSISIRCCFLQGHNKVPFFIESRRAMASWEAQSRHYKSWRVSFIFVCVYFSSIFKGFLVKIHFSFKVTVQQIINDNFCVHLLRGLLSYLGRVLGQTSHQRWKLNTFWHRYDV